MVETQISIYVYILCISSILSPLGILAPRYPDNGSPHKRQNPSDQELGFLAGKSLKRQGDGGT